MEELNTTQAVALFAEDGFDTLTAINQGEAFSLAQVAEDGDMHNVVIGPEQAAALLPILTAWLG